MRSNTDFGGKIMTKWEHINNKRSHNKRSHSHLNCSHSHSISFSVSNLVPILMGIPREGWEYHISHAHL